MPELSGKGNGKEREWASEVNHRRRQVKDLPGDRDRGSRGGWGECSLPINVLAVVVFFCRDKYYGRTVEWCVGG